MDSGLGGISVLRATLAFAPKIPLTYLCDTAGFPYGNRSNDEITTRVIALLDAVRTATNFSTVVLACNTLSTASLAILRQRYATRFVGTVPAIKVAAAQSKTRRFTLLATPNTAHSRYSKNLIAEFASDCVVDCYGAPNLARIAEEWMLGGTLDETTLRAEIAPAFMDDARGKTDAVILGCTHYPLLLDVLQRLAPWPVQWIDTSQAIARQALKYGANNDLIASVAYVTAPEDIVRYAPLFTAEGFAETKALAEFRRSG